jgi:hypothetical protein
VCERGSSGSFEGGSGVARGEHADRERKEVNLERREDMSVAAAAVAVGLSSGLTEEVVVIPRLRSGGEWSPRCVSSCPLCTNR